MLLGATVTLAVVAAVIPAFRHALTGESRDRPRVTELRGPTTLSYGSVLAVTGRASRAPGAVMLLVRWNNEPWDLLAAAGAGGARYRFVVDLDRHGTLQLRVVQPDGSVSQGSYRVVEPGSATPVQAAAWLARRSCSAASISL